MKWIVHYIIVLKYCAEEVENNVDWWFFHYHNSIMSVQNFFFTLLNNLCSLFFFFFYQTVSVTQESHWHTFTCDILVSSVKLVSGFYLNHDYICISWCKLWSIFFFLVVYHRRPLLKCHIERPVCFLCFKWLSFSVFALWHYSCNTTSARRLCSVILRVKL